MHSDISSTIRLCATSAVSPDVNICVSFVKACKKDKKKCFSNSGTQLKHLFKFTANYPPQFIQKACSMKPWFHGENSMLQKIWQAMWGRRPTFSLSTVLFTHFVLAAISRCTRWLTALLYKASRKTTSMLESISTTWTHKSSQCFILLLLTSHHTLRNFAVNATIQYILMHIWRVNYYFSIRVFNYLPTSHKQLARKDKS